MSKHTPGPWEVQIRQALMYLDLPGNTSWCKYAPWEELDPEKRANALILAAGPEMLEALEEVDHALRTHSQPG